MGKLIVRYEVDADRMPDSCGECPVVEYSFSRCPNDIWYWKRGDLPMLYAKFMRKRHKDCPLMFED